VSGGKNWEPAAYNPQLGLIYIPASEGCNLIEGVVQADFVDQGGTVKPRDRFAGGGNKNLKQTTGSVKALDPVTGEIKAAAPNRPPELVRRARHRRQRRIYRPLGRRARRL
jgi:alcohol dehydrogenase (cytochrome c)